MEVMIKKNKELESLLENINVCIGIETPEEDIISLESILEIMQDMVDEYVSIDEELENLKEFVKYQQESGINFKNPNEADEWLDLNNWYE